MNALAISICAAHLNRIYVHSRGKDCVCGGSFLFGIANVFFFMSNFYCLFSLMLLAHVSAPAGVARSGLAWRGELKQLTLY